MAKSTRDNRILAAKEAAWSRFWDKVQQGPGCWLWQGQLVRGYGIIKIGGHQALAHRAVALWAQGKAMAPLYACHRCGVRACVRPDHIYFGTAKNNAADTVRHGRNRPVSHLGETHPTAKLDTAKARAIFQAYAAGGVSLQSLADKFGVTGGAISSVVRRKTWKEATADLPDIVLTRKERGYWRGAKHLRAKITEQQVLSIKEEGRLGVKQRLLAVKYGVSQTGIGRILRGESWAHIT